MTLIVGVTGLVYVRGEKAPSNAPTQANSRTEAPPLHWWKRSDGGRSFRSRSVSIGETAECTKQVVVEESERARGSGYWRASTQASFGALSITLFRSMQTDARLLCSPSLPLSLTTRQNLFHSSSPSLSLLATKIHTANNCRRPMTMPLLPPPLLPMLARE